MSSHQLKTETMLKHIKVVTIVTKACPFFTLLYLVYIALYHGNCILWVLKLVYIAFQNSAHYHMLCPNLLKQYEFTISLLTALYSSFNREQIISYRCSCPKSSHSSSVKSRYAKINFLYGAYYSNPSIIFWICLQYIC